MKQSLASKSAWREADKQGDSSSLGLVHEKKEHFGIRGYVIPMSSHLDPKELHNHNWKASSNQHIPKLLADKKLAGKKTYLDDVILDNLKKGSPPVHSKLPNWGE